MSNDNCVVLSENIIILFKILIRLWNTQSLIYYNQIRYLHQNVQSVTNERNKRCTINIESIKFSIQHEYLS